MRKSASLLKGLSAVALSVVLAGSSVPFAWASEVAGDYSKQEVIYVKLDAAGAQKGVFVMNSFRSAEAVAVADGGVYEAVDNLTDAQQLKVGDGAVSFQVQSNSLFRYQGDLAADVQLPWAVSVSYEVDGVKVDPSKVGGASGHLKMTLSIAPNPAYDDGATDYVDNYLLQISGSLDSAMAANIQAPGATVAQAGNDTKLTYMVFPGASPSYVVEADVEDFAFGGWQIAGVELSFALDMDGIDTSAMSEMTGTLTSAVSAIDGGASQLKSGTLSLKEGAVALADGTVAVADGTESLANGISLASSGVVALADAIGGKLRSGVDALAAGSQEYYNGLGEQAERSRVAASEAEAQIDSAMSAYQSAVVAYGDASASGNVLSQLNAAAQLQTATEALVTAYSTYYGYDSAVKALEGAQESYVAIDEGIQDVASGVKDLQAGANELSSAMGQLGEGAADLSGGAGELAEGAGELVDGTKSVASGAGQLASGASQLASGTEGIDRKIVDGIRTELEGYLNPDYDPVDFMDAGNENTDLVQFVFMTEGIDTPVEAPEVEEKAEELGFFAKLLALFGIEL